MGQWSERIDRLEPYTLALAGLAVLLYLLELTGLYTALGVSPVYRVVAVGIDLVFVADLLVKLVVKRGAYLRTPWFLIDLLSTMPALELAVHLQGSLEGLRFLRTFRIFRFLRTLRILRVLRSLRLLRLAQATGETHNQHQRRFEQVLAWCVGGYAGLFLLALELMPRIAATDHSTELYLVLGSVLTMVFMVIVVRYQLPAVSSDHVRALLNVALPHQVANHLMKHPESYDETVRAPATVIFSDIKGFTSTVETLGGDLDELKRHLEAAMDAIVEAHLDNDLIVDKFIGDAVMSFRGGPLVEGDPEDHAIRVVRATLRSAKSLKESGNPFFQVIKTGGASAQDALIGTFGTSRRLSYTILGDRVNLAARLEGSCNALGVTNLFCDRTRALVGDPPDLVWRRVGKLRVQGKAEVLEVWEVFESAEDTAWLAAWNKALEAYEGSDMAAAIPGFESVLADRPDDGPAAILLAEARRVKDGRPESWEPVLRTTK